MKTGKKSSDFKGVKERLVSIQNERDVSELIKECDIKINTLRKKEKQRRIVFACFIIIALAITSVFVYQKNICKIKGHVLSDWIVEKEATCSVSGERYQICSVCSYKNIEVIPKEAHNYVNNYCTICKQHKPSEGLSISHGRLISIGTCKDTVIYIPDSVTSIGDCAFWCCSGLTSITIPNSVTSIGSGALSGCSGLTSITIPNSVTSIGGYAFAGCSGLTSITIPNSVTSIGSGALSGCSGLTSISIPDSITSIGGSAFQWINCDITYQGTMEQWMAIQKDSEWNSDFSHSVICSDGVI